jgi:hypothetical protein
MKIEIIPVPGVSVIGQILVAAEMSINNNTQRAIDDPIYEMIDNAFYTLVKLDPLFEEEAIDALDLLRSRSEASMKIVNEVAVVLERSKLKEVTIVNFSGLPPHIRYFIESIYDAVKCSLIFNYF